VYLSPLTRGSWRGLLQFAPNNLPQPLLEKEGRPYLNTFNNTVNKILITIEVTTGK
jgi:hypothetical protein